MARSKHSKDVFKERILNELNALIRYDMADPHFQMVSITKVELNDDFSVCQAYWDTFDANVRGNVSRALQGAQGKLRSLLAARLNVRHVPEVNFVYDSQYEDQAHIENLLKQEQKNDN